MNTRGSEGFGRRNRKDLGVVHSKFEESSGHRETVQQGREVKRIKNII